MDQNSDDMQTLTEDVEFFPGDAVECRYRCRDVYFNATICTRRRDGTYDLLYDGEGGGYIGDYEKRVKKEFIRKRQGTVSRKNVIFSSKTGSGYSPRKFKNKSQTLMAPRVSSRGITRASSSADGVVADQNSNKISNSSTNKSPALSDKQLSMNISGLTKCPESEEGDVITTKYKGVTRSASGWVARFKIGGRHKQIGPFSTDIEAARQYDNSIRKYISEVESDQNEYIKLLNFP
uniref:AP2/ERF domain-containing protein n=1 Tax=Aplanochytrium stocchinoi TaxID=215587 RepID=A0A6S7ZXW3_9STRA|mmetsp:Transcript_25290/g.30891  ORF Transcript_25290/g.30891 Transcript_25290/m.30891 type:complete len:235 (+) Transcript_25290:161-865(+)